MTSKSVWVGTSSTLVPIEEAILPLVFEFQDLPEDMVIYYGIRTVKAILKATGGISYSLPLMVRCGVTDYNIPTKDCLTAMAVENVLDHGDPMVFSVDLEAGQIHFPHIGRDRRVDVIVKGQLLDGACEIPKFITEHYMDAFTAGIRKYLYSIPSTDYFNLKLADRYTQELEQEIHQISNDRAFQGKTTKLMANFGRFI